MFGRSGKPVQRTACTCRNIVLGCVLSVLLLYVGVIASVYIRFKNRNTPPPPPTDAELIAASNVPPTFSQQNAIQKSIDALPPISVAWAIPVGGRTQRSDSLHAIATNLLTHGVAPEDVYIFEDVLSRPDGLGDKGVAAVAENLGMRVVPDYVKREPPGGTGVPFGLYLARHYKFMLDYVFVPGVRQQHTIDHPPRGGAEAAGDPTKLYQFIVILEDDLTLAPDTAKYFLSMSRVMAVDPTLYCACAHQDNAFLATSNDDAALARMQLTGFEFRRGNHFMAPGWMTSSRVYTDIVRPTWLDSDGNLIHGKKYIPNGHWDRFWDARIDEKECIFPSNPRIVHMGADGFTVSRAGQLELYANIRLSKAVSPATATLHTGGAPTPIVPTVSGVDYGELWRLTAQGYEFAIESFIRSATLVTVLEEMALFRSSSLVIRIEATSDRDFHWNHILATHFGIIGLGGYGGHSHYAKLRGVHRGSVFVTWLTNTVLLVGTYSPYMALIQQLKAPLVLPLRVQYRYAGCYIDQWDRDLPVMVPWYNEKNISPARCALSCHVLGYTVAGIQAGAECWCGGNTPAALPTGAAPKPPAYGKHGVSVASSSSDTANICGACPDLTSVDGGGGWTASLDGVVSRIFGKPAASNAAMNSNSDSDPAAAADADIAAASQPPTCGGPLRNSVYTITAIRVDANLPAGTDAAASNDAANTANVRTRLAAAASAPASTATPSSPSIIAPLRPTVHPTSNQLMTPFSRASMPLDLAYIKGRAGVSCDVACSETKFSTTRSANAPPLAADGPMVCRDQFLPYIHSNCPLLRSILGCDSCLAVPNAELAYMAPYRTAAQPECYLAKASYLRCDVTPALPTMHRACVCQFAGASNAVPAKLKA